MRAKDVDGGGDGSVSGGGSDVLESRRDKWIERDEQVLLDPKPSLATSLAD